MLSERSHQGRARTARHHARGEQQVRCSWQFGLIAHTLHPFGSIYAQNSRKVKKCTRSGSKLSESDTAPPDDTVREHSVRAELLETCLHRASLRLLSGRLKDTQHRFQHPLPARAIMPNRTHPWEDGTDVPAGPFPARPYPTCGTVTARSRSL